MGDLTSFHLLSCFQGQSLINKKKFFQNLKPRIPTPQFAQHKLPEAQFKGFSPLTKKIKASNKLYNYNISHCRHPSISGDYGSAPEKFQSLSCLD